MPRSLTKPQHMDFTQRSLTLRGADYFSQVRKPNTEWKKLDDLSAQLGEFELLVEAREFDTACDVLTDIDFDYLYVWGHHRLLIDLYLRLKDNLQDKILIMTNLNGLGLSYASIGRTKDAINFYKSGLKLAQEENEQSWEGAFVGNLGLVYTNLGNIQKAIDLYEQQLSIAREIGDSREEGNALGNIGNCYIELGNASKAIEYQKLALSVDQELNDFGGKALGLDGIGKSYTSLGEYKNAEVNFKSAIQIADEISFPVVQQNARNGLAETYLFQNDLVNARATIEAALQYDVPENNHNATALHGIIALRQGERETAQEAFTKSIAQAEEILAKTPEYYSALDAKGLAVSGLAICRSRLQRDTSDAEEASRSKRDLQDAVETFRTARRIAPHAGVVKSVLRLFDELVKCDEEGILKDVRNAAEGKA